MHIFVHIYLYIFIFIYVCTLIICTHTHKSLLGFLSKRRKNIKHFWRHIHTNWEWVSSEWCVCALHEGNKDEVEGEEKKEQKEHEKKKRVNKMWKEKK